MQSIGRQKMFELIEQLSPEQRQVLILKFVFDFPNVEVGDDARQDRRCGQVAAAPRARLAAEADRARRLASRGSRSRDRRPAGRGQVDAVRRAHAAARAQRRASGWRAIPDPRLEQLARGVSARKVTPAAVRVVDVRGTGPQLLGNLRQVDALLVVLDGFSGTRDPGRGSRR